MTSKYVTPKVDSVPLTLKGNPHGAKNVLQGEPVLVTDLPEHLQEALKDKTSHFAQLMKPVDERRAKKYQEGVDEGMSHEDAALHADTSPDDDTDDEGAAPGPPKAVVEAKAQKGEGPAPVAGSNPSHATPGDANPTPQIANDADAKRREATQPAPAAKPAAKPAGDTKTG